MSNFSLFLSLSLFATAWSIGVLPNFNFEKFDDQSPLSVFGGASIVEDFYRLTGTGPSLSAGVWYKSTLPLRGFRTRFMVNMTGGPADANGTPEGIAFVIQTVGLTAQGRAGAGMGYGAYQDNDPYGGIPNSIAWEMDTYNNTVAGVGDPNDHHISVHSRGLLPNSAREVYNLTIINALAPLNGGPFVLTIVYYPPVSGSKQPGVGYMTVNNEGSPRPETVVADLVSLIGSTDGTAYFGFTASTGPNGGQNHDLISWEYEYLGVTTNNSYAAGNGVQTAAAGSNASFIIQCVDQWQYPIFDCLGADFDISLSTEQNLKFVKVDNGNGTISVWYVPKVASPAGQPAQLSISLNGTLIANAPYSVAITPGGASPGKCIAFATAAEGGLSNGTAGAALTFHVLIKDRYNNTLTDLSKFKGGSTALLTSADGTVTQQVVGQPQSDGSGTFLFSYSLTKATSFSLAISVSNTDIANPDHTVIISAGPADPAATVITGLTCGSTAGVYWGFYTQLVDHYQNNVTGPDGEKDVALDISGPDDIQAEGDVVAQDNGLYSVGYNFTVMGAYNFSVVVEGIVVRNSSTTVVASSDVSPGQCLVDGDGHDEATAGEVASFTVQLVDPFGNVIVDDPLQDPQWALVMERDDDVVVTTRNPYWTTNAQTTGIQTTAVPTTAAGTTAPATTAVGTTAVGTTAARAGTTAAGTTAAAAGTTAARAGTTAARAGTTAAAAASTGVKASTTAKGPDTSPKPARRSVVKDGNTSDATTHASDAVPTTAGATTGDSHRRIEPALTSTYSGNGVFTLSYNVTVANKFLSTLTLDGQTVSTFGTVVYPGATYAADCRATGTGLSTAAAGTPVSLTITAYDAFGNLRDSGGDPFAIAILSGDTVLSTPSVNYEGASKYTASYVVYDGITVQVSITLDNVPIDGSPFSVTFTKEAPPPKPGFWTASNIEIIAGTIGGALVLIFGGLVIWRFRTKKRREYISIREIGPKAATAPASNI
eukprot:TRINITY_DN777_c0_g1_i2.p1 TRINITY_DN777_c0_g1~~TRINITY_DN777_c0_g1_i2.p1  ORF type:complete len:994 (+),score=291.39 TRINITY_DN777_c0_g1_i2:167-3148(+)